MTRDEELFISVDIETSGPVPGEYSMLSIGACVIFDVSRTFACELKPTSAKSNPDAIRVSGLSLEKLAQTGLTPRDAMSEFSEWLLRVCMANTRPIFVGFNALALMTPELHQLADATAHQLRQVTLEMRGVLASETNFP